MLDGDGEGGGRVHAAQPADIERRRDVDAEVAGPHRVGDFSRTLAGGAVRQLDVVVAVVLGDPPRQSDGSVDTLNDPEPPVAALNVAFVGFTV